MPGTSLVAQWLRLDLPGHGWGAVPGWGTKISHSSPSKEQNVKQKLHCNRFSKDLKIGPHKKKIFFNHMPNFENYCVSFTSRVIILTLDCLAQSPVTPLAWQRGLNTKGLHFSHVFQHWNLGGLVNSIILLLAS